MDLSITINIDPAVMFTALAALAAGGFTFGTTIAAGTLAIWSRFV